MKTRRVLVPLDGRPASETALPAAIEFAKESGARLYLLRVLVTLTPTAEASAHRGAVQRAERHLAAARQRLATEGVLGVSTAVWFGSPAAAIVKAADLTEADMIIMASSGRTGPPRKLVGSVVERVLRGTRRPVLVITPAEAVVDTSLGDAAPLPDRAPTDLESPFSTTPPAPVGHQPSPGDTYLDALGSLQQREQEVLRIVTTIQEAAKKLERWQAVHVAHAGAGFPKEVTMTGRAIDASMWPTAWQLADTLATWHSAAGVARVAWSHVPQAERPKLPPPP